MIIRNMILLGNEEKLKQSRLENSDERLLEISSRAIKTAVQVMMFAALAGA